jgi:hypothetical protein
MTMRQSSRILLVIVTMLFGGGAGFVGGRAQAKAKSKTVTADAGPKKDVNACGCYKDGAGACFCGKKGKCACPGECEPKGCEEKRNKEIQKEVDAETKKAHEADKKQRASSHETAAKEPKHKPSGVGQ